MTIMIYFNELYSKVDVLLIACMFQTSRKEYINVFELNPALYLFTPGYSYDAMLKVTIVNLKLNLRY